MNNFVDITSSNTSIDCIVGEQATVTFQVTNKTGKIQRTGYRIINLEKLPTDSITVSEQTEKQLEPDQTATVTVEIKLPKDVAPDTYAFNLLVFDPEVPGEQFQESKKIVTNASAKIENKKKKLPWKLIAALILSLIIIGSGAAYYLHYQAIQKEASLQKAKEEAKAEEDRKSKEEADKRAKEKAEAEAKAEEDRKSKEEANRKAKEEADRKTKEEANRKAKEEAEKKAKEEAKRKVEEYQEKNPGGIINMFVNGKYRPFQYIVKWKQLNTEDASYSEKTWQSGYIYSDNKYLTKISIPPGSIDIKISAKKIAHKEKYKSKQKDYQIESIEFSNHQHPMNSDNLNRFVAIRIPAQKIRFTRNGGSILFAPYDYNRPNGISGEHHEIYLKNEGHDGVEIVSGNHDHY